jgi:hypothetical protein
MQQVFKILFAKFKSSERCRSRYVDNIKINLEVLQREKVEYQVQDPKAGFYE